MTAGALTVSNLSQTCGKPLRRSRPCAWPRPVRSLGAVVFALDNPSRAGARSGAVISGGCLDYRLRGSVYEINDCGSGRCCF